MRASGELRRELETAVEYSPALALAVFGYVGRRSGRDAEAGSDFSPFEALFGLAETIHPGFMYLIWREPDGRHHCSLALDEHDLDRHSWSGRGATPALALASALVISLAGPDMSGPEASNQETSAPVAIPDGRAV